MKAQLVNTEFLISDNTFKFESVPSMGFGFTDVFYKGQRIAIINGCSSALQWVAKNGSNIPVSVIDRLEELVIINLVR